MDTLYSFFNVHKLPKRYNFVHNALKLGCNYYSVKFNVIRLIHDYIIVTQ